MSNHYKLRSDNTAATVIDGEVIIVNLTSGVYYSSDGVGAEVWEMMERGSSLDDIIADIVARYDVKAETARADIEHLAQRLVAENLVEQVVQVEPSAAALRDEAAENKERGAYAAPTLEIYRDMGDLLALDPPMPGLRDIPLQKSAGQGAT